MTQHQNPLNFFQNWYNQACASEAEDPNAMSLATVDAHGMPSVRIVLMKHYDEQGLVFHTNLESQKGRDLMANAHAALCFHWKSLKRSVRLQGDVHVISTPEADAYFASRPRASQIGAWASLQSRPLQNRAELEARVRRFEQQFDGQNVPRPPYWSGFRLCPIRWEFWQDQPSRLHDRWVYQRAKNDKIWSIQQLFP
ncbi:MAG TPA: pyridoxamine 5'-phosphate oxidase [Alphaproteobacteria bacterium]|nr:pyridoxamine 5'-phosphate oxidase [Alphaproteobacteria bacterium]